MPRIQTCPQGHPFEVGPDENEQPTCCPVCGSACSPSLPDVSGLPPTQRVESPPFFLPPEWRPEAGVGNFDNLPDYELLGEIGRGGDGVVFKARHVPLKRVVALKMLLGGSLSNPEQLVRFRREAEALARLHHAHIVQIHEVGEYQGVPYFTMEFVPGSTLAHRRSGSSPLPARRAAELIEPVARAMHAAHQAGVVHRDLKPANVLLTPEGQPKVTDFGLAKFLQQEGVTRTNGPMGTPSYMAPEQARGDGEAITPATDVYALGAILYELLTGRPPFVGESPWDTVQQVLAAEPVPPRRLQPKIPGDVEVICLKCLEKDPRRRYASAEDLADDLRCWLVGKAVRARPVGAGERLWRWCRHNRAVAVLLGATGALIATVVAVLATATVLLSRSQGETKRALAEVQTREVEAAASRDQAQENFEMARKTVDEICTRLSEDQLLNEPGMEEVRKELLLLARRYYQEFVARRTGEAAYQAEFGRACRRLACLMGDLDSQQDPLPLCTEAVTVFERLVGEHPGVPSYQSELALACFELGRLHFAKRADARADKAYRRARSLAEQLVKDHPSVAAYQNQLGMILNEQGKLHSAAGRVRQAEETHQQALSLRKKLVKAHPADDRYRDNLAATWNNLGHCYLVTGRKEEALKALRAALALETSLVRDRPRMRGYRETQATLLENLGVLYLDTRQLEKCEESLSSSLRIWSKLARDYPRIGAYPFGLSRCLLNLGHLHSDRGEKDRAISSYQQAQELLTPLVEDNPRTIGYAWALAQCDYSLGEVYLRTEQNPLAEKALGKAIDRLETLARDHPEDLRFRIWLAKSFAGKGKLAMAQENPGAARTWYVRAVQTLEGVLRQEPRHTEARELLDEVRKDQAATNGRR